MTIFQAVASGAVQGLTEFFPVSSSGHLVILHSLFGIKEPQVAFDITLHLGTLAAILLFFRRDILELARSGRRTLFFLLTASMVTFVIAMLFNSAVERSFGEPKIVSCMFILTGVWLILAHIVSAHFKNIGFRKEMSLFISLIIGIAQGAGIFPGISRSGATIGAGMLSGLDREKALRFSFLLAIPAILGAAVFKARAMGHDLLCGQAFYFIAGGVTAALIGFFSIKVLFKIIKTNIFSLFGVYCISLGVIFLSRYY